VQESPQPAVRRAGGLEHGVLAARIAYRTRIHALHDRVDERFNHGAHQSQGLPRHKARSSAVFRELPGASMEPFSWIGWVAAGCTQGSGCTGLHTAGSILLFG
jgi:hypothetical protein